VIGLRRAAGETLTQYLIKAYFCSFVFMMRNRNVTSIQFAEEKRCLGKKTRRDRFHQVIMVWITLFENVDRAISSNMDSFHPFIEGQIVGVVDGWSTENTFARVGNKHQ
jgi:hypothetical protein